eukprot:CAMPEP_0206436544 /NCGR_PEP_ID=MMETSP0324_2-20121206/10538_1 /ASSEMBLY_ACC=CAM_ASM_000836 /TAXON_ID=2866 /ORGANISM="Crypthecodinium cohnii, Strain Seligo" /LENGTH=41 /DNA_ID= /DNA_START= /DNA_END= /DNA_ORIENTATION=
MPAARRAMPQSLLPLAESERESAKDDTLASFVRMGCLAGET